MGTNEANRWSLRLGGDKVLWTIVITLGFMSLLVVYSSAGASVYSASGDRSHFSVLMHQLGMVLMGIGVHW